MTTNFHPKPKIVPKPWGREIWWAQANKYVGKLLIINRGHRLSLQYHKKKHETIYTLSGRWRLVLGKPQRVNTGGKGSTTFPPVPAAHMAAGKRVGTAQRRTTLRLKHSIQKPGSVTNIPPKTVHRFEAPFGRATLIEVSTPEVWDVVRLQDDYRRSNHGH